MGNQLPTICKEKTEYKIDNNGHVKISEQDEDYVVLYVTYMLFFMDNVTA